MADQLDDFFAKKDKKKGKGKAVLSAGALVKELEEGAKKESFPVRNKTSASIGILGLDAQDEEWRDFEDVEKRDYTGLKVKEMSLQDQQAEEHRRAMAELAEQQPDAWKTKGESKSTSNQTPTADDATVSTPTSQPDAPEGPSKDNKDVTDKSAVSNSEETDKKSEKPEQKESETKSAKPAYVPPQARNSEFRMATTDFKPANSEFKVLEPIRLSKIRGTSVRHGAIPNIQDEKAFPSLG